MTASIVGLTPPPTRREELGEFLRHLRERISPESLGLPATGRRRTPGLRREEVCQLAGVGLSWYTWLEQGRDISPSPSVLDALARVFDLTSTERRHLYDLAGVPVPSPEEPYPTQAPDELAVTVAALDPWPAYLLNPRTDILAWNRGAYRVIGEPAAAPDGRLNLMWWLFTALDAETDPRGEDAAWRRGRSQTARLTLARFRAAHARRYDDPDFRALIEALLDVSPAFRELWPRHEVRDHQLGTKVVDRPQLNGRMTFHHLQSIPTSHPDLRLIQFIPADPATRAGLAA